MSLFGHYMVIFMLAWENAANLTRQLTIDNQLEDGGKTHVVHLKTF